MGKTIGELMLPQDGYWLDKYEGGSDELPSKEELDFIFDSHLAPYRLYVVESATGKVVYYREK